MDLNICPNIRLQYQCKTLKDKASFFFQNPQYDKHTEDFRHLDFTNLISPGNSKFPDCHPASLWGLILPLFQIYGFTYLSCPDSSKSALPFLIHTQTVMNLFHWLNTQLLSLALWVLLVEDDSDKPNAVLRIQKSLKRTQSLLCCEPEDMTCVKARQQRRLMCSQNKWCPVWQRMHHTCNPRTQEGERKDCMSETTLALPRVSQKS